MPDISMCTLVTCTKSETCFRHEDSETKPTKGRQTWFAPRETDENCEYYWHVEKE